MEGYYIWKLEHNDNKLRLFKMNDHQEQDEIEPENLEEKEDVLSSEGLTKKPKLGDQKPRKKHVVCLDFSVIYSGTSMEIFDAQITKISEKTIEEKK